LSYGAFRIVDLSAEKKTAPTISKTGHPSASINLYYQDNVLLCREYGESTSNRIEAKKTAFLFKVISD